MCKFYKIESQVNLTFPTNDLRLDCVYGVNANAEYSIVVVDDFLRYV
jgi:hypothetical protein